MKDAARLKTAVKGDEDDWETAEIAPPQAKPPTLRPSAPEFKPTLRPPVIPPATMAQAGGPSGPGQRSLLNRGNNGVGTGEDEWFGSRRPVTNRQIWDSANAAPPPVTLAPSSHSTMTSTPIGPPGPTMQILRRIPPSNTSRPTSDESRRAKTLEEREEEYRLARERIFGAGGGGGVGGEGSGRSSPVVIDSATGISALGVVPSQVRRSPAPRTGGSSPGVVRQPRGPAEGSEFGR